MLDMPAVSDWVMNSHKVADDPRTGPYEKLEQKLFAHAKDFGCEDLVIYDKETEKYYLTAEHNGSGWKHSAAIERDNTAYALIKIGAALVTNQNL